jgi:hypothetical protein
MSSVVENQTELTGRVLARRPHPSVDHWDQLRVDVAAADPVDPLPNLLARTVGQQVTIAVNRDELPAGDLDGFEFTGPVRLAGPETVVAVPAGAGLGRPTLTPPTGPVPTVAGGGFPAEPPDVDDGGPRPVL